MCRIAGIVNPQPEINTEAIIERMCQSMSHGGPDDKGVWVDKDKGVFLGHRRLSIIDLSEKGHQPMRRGSHVISFNGEIFK